MFPMTKLKEHSREIGYFRGPLTYDDYPIHPSNPIPSTFCSPSPRKGMGPMPIPIASSISDPSFSCSPPKPAKTPAFGHKIARLFARPGGHLLPALKELATLAIYKKLLAITVPKRNRFDTDSLLLLGTI